MSGCTVRQPSAQAPASVGPVVPLAVASAHAPTGCCPRPLSRTLGAALVRHIPVGPLQCNMTIIADPVTKHALLVDPGGDADVSRQLTDAQSQWRPNGSDGTRIAVWVVPEH